MKCSSRLLLAVDDSHGGNRDTFTLLLGDTIQPSFLGLDISSLTPQTQALDLLLDEQFVNQAATLPSLNALPIRLETSNLIVNGLEIYMTDDAGSVFGGTGLPGALTLANFQPGRNELVLEFRQKYTVSVNEAPRQNLWAKRLDFEV